MSAVPRKTAFTLTFPMYDNGTGKLKTGLTVTAQISKDQAALAATTNAPTEIGGGLYAVLLTSTEMDAQVNALEFTATGALATTAQIVTDPDIYTAKVSLTLDAVNVTDRWEVTWFKNGAPYVPTSGTPQIQVIKASDGSDLIAATNMTQIAATGRWKYDAVTTARVATGATYTVKLTATIDGSTRTWEETKGVSRDN